MENLLAFLSRLKSFLLVVSALADCRDWFSPPFALGDATFRIFRTLPKLRVVTIKQCRL